MNLFGFVLFCSSLCLASSLSIDNDETLRREIETNEILGFSSETKYWPIVYYHGMGDNAGHVKSALSFIEKKLPGVYVKSLQFGNNVAEDTKSGYFANINDQVNQACAMIKNDSSLQGGFNAIGLSQGGQFLRAIAQRCPDPPMYNLISLGGQHQGVFGVPQCSAQHSWCKVIDRLLTHFAYEDWVQKSLLQAAYWHDPFKQEVYAQNSIFLADINNEKAERNESYRDNLLKLKNLVLVMFKDETVVQPKESEWFGFYEENQSKKIVPVQDSLLYTEDRIGLKELNDTGRLHFLLSDGNHLQFTEQWFLENILKPFLT